LAYLPILLYENGVNGNHTHHHQNQRSDDEQPSMTEEEQQAKAEYEAMCARIEADWQQLKNGRQHTYQRMKPSS
jgi:hypothetical protein